MVAAHSLVIIYLSFGVKPYRPATYARAMGCPRRSRSHPSRDPVAWLFLDASLEPLEGRVDDALLRLPLDHADHGHTHVDGELVRHLGLAAALGEPVGAGHAGQH